MRYKELFEVYSSDNQYLLKYLKDGKFDPYASWWAVCDAIDNNEEWHEAMEEVLDKDFTEDDLNEQEPDVFYDLPEDIQREIAAHVIDYLMVNDPAEAPTTAHVSLNQNRLMHRQSWLIHFTDDPDGIESHGFTKGVSDMDKLGLTTSFKNDSSYKSYGGYNFAFDASGRYAQNAAARQKYGKHAVMFQNSGVRTWHHGDEEEQIIFWGPDVKPRDIVVLKHYDAWNVMTRAEKAMFSGDFEAAVRWLMQNFQQYRKALTSF